MALSILFCMRLIAIDFYSSKFRVDHIFPMECWDVTMIAFSITLVAIIVGF